MHMMTCIFRRIVTELPFQTFLNEYLLVLLFFIQYRIITLSTFLVWLLKYPAFTLSTFLVESLKHPAFILSTFSLVFQVSGIHTFGFSILSLSVRHVHFWLFLILSLSARDSHARYFFKDLFHLSNIHRLDFSNLLRLSHFRLLESLLGLW